MVDFLRHKDEMCEPVRTNNVRTTTTERLDYLRLFLGCLEANVAIGNDIDDVIRDLRRAIRRRQREEQGQ